MKKHISEIGQRCAFFNPWVLVVGCAILFLSYEMEYTTGLRFMFRVHHPQMIDFENVIGLRESLKTPLQIPHIRNIEFFQESAYKYSHH